MTRTAPASTGPVPAGPAPTRLAPTRPAPAGLEPTPTAPLRLAVRQPTGRPRILRYLADGAPLAIALFVAGVATAWNLQGYPGRANDDEGTYVDRAWAMLAVHHLSNYTYFWDHPFLGWAEIAVWSALTDGFSRDARAVMVGREFMWVTTMVSSVLLYVLARRIGMKRGWAAAAVLIFGASPLDIWYHRMVSLDNLATMWALAALVLAASRRRSWAAAIGSGACFAIAFWNKETILLLLPAVLWLLRQYTEPSTRLANISSFCVLALGGIALYPLLAILKGELLPGRGHDSLWSDGIVYQLTRPGTGSLLDKHSGTYFQFNSWLGLDHWLVLAGGAAMCTGFLVRRLRPFALALLIQLAVMVKGGYVPYAFPTAMLPFAALLIAGTADAWWRPIGRVAELHSSSGQHGIPGQHGKRITRPVTLGLRHIGKVPVVSVVILFAIVVAPSWLSWLQWQSKINGFATENAAVSWVSKNVPRGDIVVCDAYPWLDIKLHTRATPLYLWQIDSDPQVMRTELPDGYKDISYLVLEPSSPLTFAALPGRPTLQQAIKNSAVVAKFGTIVIYKVGKPAPHHRNHRH